MELISLNDFGKRIDDNGYYLEPTVKYIINLENEIYNQTKIFESFVIMGPAPAIKNYHAWLNEHGFNTVSPNPTNDFVASYYGVKPLWKTEYSQGVVVKAVNDDDYYIVMECSSKNRGYKHTQIIVTMGGCL